MGVDLGFIPSLLCSSDCAAAQSINRPQAKTSKAQQLQVLEDKTKREHMALTMATYAPENNRRKRTVKGSMRNRLNKQNGEESPSQGRRRTGRGGHEEEEGEGGGGVAGDRPSLSC